MIVVILRSEWVGVQGVDLELTPPGTKEATGGDSGSKVENVNGGDSIPALSLASKPFSQTGTVTLPSGGAPLYPLLCQTFKSIH